MIDITIGGTSFSFDPESEVETEAGGCDLYVTEPGFAESTRELKHHFTSKSIVLPYRLDRRVRRVGLKPCSRIWIDAEDRKRLWAYFD